MRQERHEYYTCVNRDLLARLQRILPHDKNDEQSNRPKRDRKFESTAEPAVTVEIEEEQSALRNAFFAGIYI